MVDLVKQKFAFNQQPILEPNSFFKIASDVCRDMQLEPSTPFLEKIYEVWEILSNRNGVILLGSALAGKSSIFKVLAKVFPKVSEASQNEDARVVFQVISPWSLPSKYLYEWRDPEKNKWNDGVITKALRELSINSPTSPRWLILDGVLHSELTGHLHTILDSSRKLALPSGEILQVCCFYIYLKLGRKHKIIIE